MSASAVWLRVLCLIVLTMPSCGKKDTYGTYQEQQQKQQNAAAALREQGATLEEKHYKRGDAWAINLKGKQISGDVIDRLAKMGHITELNLSGTNVTDADLTRINELGIGAVMLQLDLSHTEVSDAGLDQLTNFFLLSDLNLTGTKVTAAGVGRFRTKRAGDQRIMAAFKSPKIRL